MYGLKQNHWYVVTSTCKPAATSVFVLTETSRRSPPKKFIFITKNKMHRFKVSNDYLLKFKNTITGSCLRWVSNSLRILNNKNFGIAGNWDVNISSQHHVKKTKKFQVDMDIRALSNKSHDFVSGSQEDIHSDFLHWNYDETSPLEGWNKEGLRD